MIPEINIGLIAGHDMLLLFSANPATYNRSGKVIPQLKDRIGSVIHTHYPRGGRSISTSSRASARG